MQRLYGLRQLGLTDRIFIDASHARIHHVVGVLQQVDNLVLAIVNNLRRSDRNLRIGAGQANQETFPTSKLAAFVDKRRPVIRFIGLLHDLTHAPFGHTVEDEIGLVASKHDEPSRQAYAFYRLLCQLLAWLSVEASGPSAKELPQSLRPFMSQAAAEKTPNPLEVGALGRALLSEIDPSRIRLCWRLSQPELAEMLAQLRCAMTALLHLEALHKTAPGDSDLPDKADYPFQIAIKEALQETEFESLLADFEFQPNRDAFMLDIVGNTVCADLLDYAKRDSHFAGLRLDYDPERIAENFTLVSHDAAAYEVNHPQAGGRAESGEAKGSGVFEGWCLRTAISLVSHKYRTDVPSELMNLLNVRYYLYERAIYHPTKCAAGSMLGTALQLLGWRKSSNGEKPDLPAHLRFVGDDVFLHDISAALDFALRWVSNLPSEARIDAKALQEIRHIDSVHNGLVPELLNLRLGQDAAETREEWAAARLLLDRLAARRYFRPVFRALPSSSDPRLHAGPEALADVFRQPDQRYDIERRIELESQLPLGTVTIHCPVRKTARKIANVLLTKPGQDGVDGICKLKDIGDLDPLIFGEHQKAVKAVEEMYGSMWRLTVYVAPEHLPKFEAISEAAGRIIFKTIDTHDQFSDSNLRWPNDENLNRELAEKSAPALRGTPSDDSELSSLGIAVGRLSDQLAESGKITIGPHDRSTFAGGLSPKILTKIENALVSALGPSAVITTSKPVDYDPAVRVNRLHDLFRTYMKRMKREDVADFKARYSEPLNGLPEEDFESIVSGLGAAILETNKLDTGAATVHKGFKFHALLEVLDDLLKGRGVSPPPRTNLFGGRT